MRDWARTSVDSRLDLDAFDLRSFIDVENNVSGRRLPDEGFRAVSGRGEAGSVEQPKVKARYMYPDLADQLLYYNFATILVVVRGILALMDQLVLTVVELHFPIHRVGKALSVAA